MEFSIKNVQPGRAESGCTVVGVFDSGKLSESARELDQAAKGELTRIVKRGDMEGKSGTMLFLHGLAGIRSQRVLLVGLGAQKEFGAKQYREAIATCFRALASSGATDAEVHLTALEVDGRDAKWRVQQAVTLAHESAYRFEIMKSHKEKAKAPLRQVTLVLADKSDVRSAERGLTQGFALARGMALTKDLGNLPPNVCTPSYLADQAREIARTYKMKVQVLDRADMQKLGMRALLAVALGSHEPPKFIVLEHFGGKKGEKPVVLVGKGITFDTGGISIKPSPEMDEVTPIRFGRSLPSPTRTRAIMARMLSTIAGGISWTAAPYPSTSMSASSGTLA